MLYIFLCCYDYWSRRLKCIMAPRPELMMSHLTDISPGLNEWRHKSGLALFQKIVCRLFCDKSFPGPMPIYWLLYGRLRKQTSVKLYEINPHTGNVPENGTCEQAFCPCLSLLNHSNAVLTYLHPPHVAHIGLACVSEPDQHSFR